MTNPAARQPQGIPTGGQFAPDVRTEPTITLSRDEDKVHATELSGTIKLRNASFDQLPEWPAGMPEPTVSFDFSDGKCLTNIMVDDRTMTFWDSDIDGTINDTDNGTNPWEDFDDEDQEKALQWCKRVHQRIDSSTYGIMIEATSRPAVSDAVLAHALGKEPVPAGPDLTDRATRDAYVIAAADRLAKAERELQQVYMIGAAQELRAACPDIDAFELTVDERGRLEIAEAWDADGNSLDGESVYSASIEVFRYRNEDDFSTFLDGQRVAVDDATGFRPGI